MVFKSRLLRWSVIKENEKVKDPSPGYSVLNSRKLICAIIDHYILGSGIVIVDCVIRWLRSISKVSSCEIYRMNTIIICSWRYTVFYWRRDVSCPRCIDSSRKEEIPRNSFSKSINVLICIIYLSSQFKVLRSKD